MHRNEMPSKGSEALEAEAEAEVEATRTLQIRETLEPSFFVFGLDAEKNFRPRKD